VTGGQDVARISPGICLLAAERFTLEQIWRITRQETRRRRNGIELPVIEVLGPVIVTGLGCGEERLAPAADQPVPGRRLPALKGGFG
jgi:hypothetical protein